MSKTNSYNSTWSEIRSIKPNDETMSSYADIQTIIEEIFNNNGINILSEKYRLANNGEYVHASYVTDIKDGDNTLIFNWVGSYNKTAGFKSTFGLTVGSNKAIMIPTKGNTQSKRSFTETTLDHVKRQVTMQVTNYKSIINSVNNEIKDVDYVITKEKLFNLIGEIFLSKSLLTNSQLLILKKNLLSEDKKLESISYKTFVTACLSITYNNKPSRWISTNKDIYNTINNFINELTSEIEDDYSSEVESIDEQEVESLIVQEQQAPVELNDVELDSVNEEIEVPLEQITDEKEEVSTEAKSSFEGYFKF